MKYAVLVFVVTVSSLSCKKEENTKSELTKNCSPLSGFGIVGGEKTTAFPEVIQLRHLKSIQLTDSVLEISHSQCTGSFYSDTKFVTNAHCIKGNDFIHEIEVAGQTFRSEKFTIFSKYLEKGNPSVDIAIITFDLEEVRPTIVKIGPPAKKGDKVTLVGFGDNEAQIKDVGFEGYSKFMGVTNVDKIIRDDLEILSIYLDHGSNADNTPPRASHGDSGGSVFNSNGEAIGLAAASLHTDIDGRYVNPTKHDSLVSTAVTDLNALEIRKFMISEIGPVYTHEDHSEATPVEADPEESQEKVEEQDSSDGESSPANEAGDDTCS